MFEIGNSLRDARLRQKLDFPEVEQAVKIRARYLRALEDEEFDVLPAQTYVKGFLRSYAEFLGLDGQLYVDEYNSRFAVDDEHTLVRPRRSTARPRERRHRRLERNVLVGALVAIVAVTVLVFAAWRFGGAPDSETSVANLNERGSAAQAPARAARPTRRPAPVTPAAKPKPPTTTELVARAARDCWLEVHAGSATGRLLFQGTLEEGQRQRFVAKRIWMNVGVPENLRLRLNGKVVRLRTTGTPQVVIVSPSGIRPVTA
jgi:cytoskeletal protein RodZ